MYEEQRIEIEAMKLALSGIEAKGLSSKAVLIKSIQKLHDLYKTTEDKKVLQKAEEHMRTYQELGHPTEDFGFIKESFEKEGMPWDYENRPNREIRLNKIQVRTMLGRWNPRIHSMPIAKVVEDIIGRVKNKEYGTYRYYSGNQNYQLFITETESLFYDWNKRIYYTLRGEENRDVKDSNL